MLVAEVTLELQASLTEYVWLASMVVSNADMFRMGDRQLTFSAVRENVKLRIHQNQAYSEHPEPCWKQAA